MMGVAPELAAETELEFHRERARQRHEASVYRLGWLCRGCEAIIYPRVGPGPQADFCSRGCRRLFRYHESRPGARVLNPRKALS